MFINSRGNSDIRQHLCWDEFIVWPFCEMYSQSVFITFSFYIHTPDFSVKNKYLFFTNCKMPLKTNLIKTCHRCTNVSTDHPVNSVTQSESCILGLTRRGGLRGGWKWKLQQIWWRWSCSFSSNLHSWTFWLTAKKGRDQLFTFSYIRL